MIGFALPSHSVSVAASAKEPPPNNVYRLPSSIPDMVRSLNVHAILTGTRLVDLYRPCGSVKFTCFPTFIESSLFTLWRFSVTRQKNGVKDASSVEHELSSTLFLENVGMYA